MTTPSHYHSHVDDAAAAGGRLKEARLAAGLSQRQLAFPGCSAAYISRLEAGQRVASLQLLRKIAAKLGADEEYLATGVARERPRSAELVEADVALRLDDLETAQGLYERALKTSSDPRARGEALGGLGRLALRLGDAAQAVDSIEEAFRIAPELASSLPGLVETLGKAHAATGELESAIAVFERGAGDAAAAGDLVAQTRCEIWLANALIDSGGYGRAGELLGGALARSEKTVEPAERARIYWSQSRLHTLKGDQDAAARFARKTLELLELGEDVYNTARAHQLLAFIAVERSRGEEALDHVERGLALLGKDVSPVEIAKFRIEEARALVLLERNDEAGAAAMSVQALLADAEPDDAGRAFTVLGDVHRQLGDTARAREIWELAVELLEREPNPYVGDVYERLGAVLEEEGHTQEALQMLKRAVSARQRATAH
ncbi:MAG: tetratricopeptide repeat protein [Actinomycetota bacterium]|nr:tetratricopeptide repeat protein [Actinomycetota bacterium]